ncbi:hypothetical protein IPZ68_08585 [Streptomyces arenae]|nr:hypothetical protein [Streptomyces arenae]
MTAPPAPPVPPPPARVRTRTAGCTIAADGSYAARLARATDAPDSWCPERWTLGSAEPYAVPLPGRQPEEPATEVLPMADGRVLIHRVVDVRHTFALLYPTGPGTGEVPLGAVECGELGLLPPTPDGTRAYALAPGEHSSAVWLVAGGAFGPEHVAEIPGRCSGGVWLDGTDRMLALDRTLGSTTKTVAVDLERGGEVTPLLQIAEDSDDRLLLADAGSGLLVIRSDAPGEDRLGWGVLGGTRPVRFPECLRFPADLAGTPFAIQPGQVLTPEGCGVALRIDGAAGSSWVGLWHPASRQLHQLAAPEGWLAGAGWWTPEGTLCLPYATGAAPCGVARLTVPAPTAPSEALSEPLPGSAPGPSRESSREGDASSAQPPPADPPKPVAARPVPLQQAPLGGRKAGG